MTITTTSTPAWTPTADNDTTNHAVSHLHQQFVDHSYTDYARVDEDDLRLMKENSRSGGAETKAGTTITESLLDMSCSYGPMKSKGHGGSVMMPFPGKLLEVLDRGDLTSIIDWMPHGRAFIVKQPKVFTTQVLSRFFKQTKFLSFTRQINLWGFKRITRGIDAGAYYHALFLPGRPNLAMRMKRQKIKGTGIRPIPNPNQEPNFYYQFPHVARVPQSSVPIPLPPLPSERIANLMHGGVGGEVNTPGQSVVPQHHVLVESQSLVPQQATALQSNLGNGLSSRSAMNRDRGLSVASPRLSGLQGDATTDPWVASSNKLDAISAASDKLDAMSAALAAEFRLQGLMKPSGGLHQPSTSSYSSLLGFPNVNNGHSSSAVFPESSSASSDLDSSLFFRRAALSALAPRSFHPAINVQDEVSSANRRLMERLMDQTTSAPAPEGILRHSKPESTLHPLYRDIHEASLLGRTSVAPPSYQETTQLQRPSYRELHEASLLGRTSVAPPSYQETTQPQRPSYHELHEASLLGRTSVAPPSYQESTQLQRPSYHELHEASLLGRTSVAPPSYQESTQPQRPSYRELHEASLIGRTSVAPPSYQESTQPQRPSYRELHEASLLGRTSVAPPAARRESFKLHQSLHHATHHTAAAAAPMSSLYDSYLPRPKSRSSLPSRTATQDINVATVTNALRNAEHLEELARSGRERARALAGALQQQVGYDVQDLLPFGGEFNEGERGGREWK